jgi:hypothetical protein
LLVLAALLAPAAAAAQAPRVDVVPFAGVYRPVQSLPLVREDGQMVSASLDDGTALGVHAQVRVLGPLAVRGTWLHARSRLSVGSSEATTRRTPARVNMLVADLVVSGPRLLVARSYLVVGTGTRRYSFDQERLGPGAAEAFGGGVTDQAGHLGVGIEAAAGPLRVTVEASDYTSVARSAQAGASTAGVRQHDLVLSVGARLRAF